jgi:hypothetical protein
MHREGAMTAETVKDAQHRLHELHQDERADLVLAALAMGLAILASFLHPALAMPLFIGALASSVLAGRAFFRRSELFDRLLLDREAYTIPEVRRRAEQIASMESRHALAQTVRARLTPASGCSRSPRVSAASGALEALAAELDDETLSLDLDCAVRCHQLLNNYGESPLLNYLLPEDDVQNWVRRIRCGFEARSPAER